MEPRGTLGRIYKEDHYTLLLTKYESSGPCGFGEEDFFKVFPMTPPGRVRMDPRGTVGRIYKEEHYTLLQRKYDSIQFNSILYSDCQIHFSASTKQSIQIHKYTNLTYFIVSTG